MKRYCDATCRSRARRERQADARASSGLSPFARVLTGAIHDKAIPLEALVKTMEADGCAVSPSALSNWQTGKNLPRYTRFDRNKLLSLERALDLPPATLVLPWRRLAVRPPARPPAPRGHDLAARRVRIERRICGQPGGAVSRQDLILIREAERHVIGRGGRPKYSKITLEVQALAEGIDSYWYVVSVARGADIKIKALRGCQQGIRLEDRQAYPAAAEYLVATELMLDEPLREGQTRRITYRVEHIDGQVSTLARATVFRRVLSSPAVRELDLAIDFESTEPPECLTYRTWEHSLRSAAEPDRRVAPSTSDRVRITKPAARGYGWAWTWPADSISRAEVPA